MTTETVTIPLAKYLQMEDTIKKQSEIIKEFEKSDSRVILLEKNDYARSFGYYYRPKMITNDEAIAEKYMRDFVVDLGKQLDEQMTRNFNLRQENEKLKQQAYKKKSWF